MVMVGMRLGILLTFVIWLGLDESGYGNEQDGLKTKDWRS